MTKKRSKRAYLPWAAGAALLLAGLGVSACGGDPDVGDSPSALREKKQQMDRRLDRVLDRLNATSGQRARIHQLKDEVVRKALPLRRSHRQVRDKLRAEWASPRPDRRAIHEAVDRQIDQVRALAHVAVDRAVDVHALLSAEQRAELLRLIDQLHQMRRMWHGG